MSEDSVGAAPQNHDAEMEQILRSMLEADQDITARGVIRLHSQLKAASSITRSQARLALLEKYKAKQAEYRGWQKRIARKSFSSTAMDMAEKDMRVVELEKQVELLISSHVAMIRAVGELGGFSKWVKFFEQYDQINQELGLMGALPQS